jgi:integrase
MSVSKRGKTWYVKFRPFGDSIQLALNGCEGKVQGKAIESELLNALQQRDYSNLTGVARQVLTKLFINQKWEMPEELSPREIQAPPKILTLWTTVQLYTSDESFRILSKPERYHLALAHLVGFFGKNRPVKELWIPDLKLYRGHRTSQGASNASINREISALSGVFRVAIEHQLLEINPCRQISALSEKSGERQVYMSYEDVQRIIAQCPEWYQDMIWVSYLTGMRKGEVFNLRWRHINLKNRIITLHATETKEGKSKRIPIHKDLLPVFERLGRIRSLADDRIIQVSHHSLRMPWVRALDKLQWEQPRPKFHDLRHTWKTNARRSGIDSEIREMILGHANRKLDVSERYGFVSDEELLSAIDRFTYDHGLTQILVASNAGK